MMKKLIMIAAVLFSGMSLMAEEKALPSADRSAGMPVMEAFARRKSVRNFSGREQSPMGSHGAEPCGRETDCAVMP